MFGRPFCKTVRPMLSDRCLSCLSVSPVCDVRVLWPNGWMDQDETWRGGRPRPWPHCVRWGTSSPKGAQQLAPPHFSTHVTCGQTAKVPLGRDVDFGPDDIVLEGDPAALERGTAAPPPLFGPCLLWPNGHQSQLRLSSCLIFNELGDSATRDH